MSDRIDHAKESNKIADDINERWVSEEGATDATLIWTAIDALRHATLAAADQQRIANLLALAQFSYSNDERQKVGTTLKGAISMRFEAARLLGVEE
jgi:hypothetical protein